MRNTCLGFFDFLFKCFFFFFLTVLIIIILNSELSSYVRKFRKKKTSALQEQYFSNRPENLKVHLT